MKLISNQIKNFKLKLKGVSILNTLCETNSIINMLTKSEVSFSILNILCEVNSIIDMLTKSTVSQTS